MCLLQEHLYSCPCTSSPLPQMKRHQCSPICHLHKYSDRLGQTDGEDRERVLLNSCLLVWTKVRNSFYGGCIPLTA